MCGIIFGISKTIVLDTSSEWTRLQRFVSKRGPDFQSQFTKKHRDWNLSFYSSVLSLRGEQVCPQPFSTKDSVLCYNGEIYDGFDIKINQNDGQILFQYLNQCTSHSQVLQLLHRPRGEWALVFYSKPLERIYFSRDCLGRKSLVSQLVNNQLIVASVGLSTDEWTEVPAIGIHFIDLSMDSLNIQVADLSKPFTTINETVPLPIIATDPELSELPSNDPELSNLVVDFKRVLSDSVRKRVESIPTTQETRLGILFSGGLDCSTLAAIAHDHIPSNEPIDLINVAFENPRVAALQKAENPYDICPDRATAKQAFTELMKFKREWRLWLVDVPFSEFEMHKTRVQLLSHPSDTVMDLSISIAFWFASRAKGRMVSSLNFNGSFENGVEGQSTARVLFSGLGADEQLGGYSRHKIRFKQQGYRAVIAELQKDVDRISQRNLGRDDRIISDNGKEVRFPFLDESVIDWLCRLAVNYKIDENGIDKKILRCLAREFELERTSQEPKRAVQFGARTAKMTDSKQKGTDSLE